ncbi:MAG: porin [Aaplasma endosymbiont of Hyalomma asiaticum]
MTRVSLSTALVTLLMCYGANDAYASSTTHQRVQGGERGVTTKRAIVSDHIGRYISVSPSIDISGSLSSHGWFAYRDSYYHSKGISEKLFLTSELLRQHGISTDAMLQVSAEGRNDSLGIYYGGRIELDVPYTQQADYTSFKQVKNRGSKVYLNTAYGDFGFGYQVGIDSIMKIDAFSIGAGDSSNTWMRYVNLRGIHDPLKNKNTKEDPATDTELRRKYLENVFYLSTGLYSEGLFDGGNRFAKNSLQPVKERSISITNHLPVRFSYLSPSFGGLKVGVSYAPYGYDEDRMLRTHTSLDEDYIFRLRGEDIPDALLLPAPARARSVAIVSKRKKINRTQFIMPMYEHLVNVGMTYSSYFSGLDFKLSMVSEYAKGKTRLLDNSNDNAFSRMDSIKNVAFGGMLRYKNIKFAVSYGYLGRIDRISNMYSFSNGKFTLKTDDKIVINVDGTYFWTIGGGYEYNGLYVSAIYRGSNYSGNRFDELTFGAEYDISGISSRVKCAVFTNYHSFTAKSAFVVSAAETDGSNKGQVILTGMKVRF